MYLMFCRHSEGRLLYLEGRHKCFLHDLDERESFKELDSTPSSRNGRRMKTTGYHVRIKPSTKNKFLLLFNIYV